MDAVCPRTLQNAFGVTLNGIWFILRITGVSENGFRDGPCCYTTTQNMILPESCFYFDYKYI